MSRGTLEDRLDTMWPRVIAISEEVAATLIRTAFSHDVIVGHDMSAAVFDDRGLMLAQTKELGTPGHLGAMPYFMLDLLQSVAASEMKPGDVFITNDPWIHSGHTADVFVASPVFRASTIVGFVVTCIHHLDIGGRAGSGESREVFEEGLIIPISRLSSAEGENELLTALIERNVRYSAKVLGDLRAQIAAGFKGGQLLLEFAEREDLTDFRSLTDLVAARTEAGMRAGLSVLADGTYHSETAVDVPGGDPLKLVLTLTKEGSDVHVDFTGTSSQVARPINCPLRYARAYVTVALKMVCGGDMPYNAGTGRMIGVSAPEGCLLNPTFPAPVFWRMAVGLLAADLVFDALSESAAEAVPAGSGSIPVWQNYVSGKYLGGSTFTLHNHAFGGMGAMYGKDGRSSVSFPYHVRGIPVEVAESEVPLIFKERQLQPNSGGNGRWRGGLGERITLSCDTSADIEDELLFSGGTGRMKRGAPGMQGGESGAPGVILLNGEAIGPTASPEVPFRKGDELTLVLPGGGGYGAFAERTDDLINADVESGYIAP